jgi:hypothetical protein
LPTPDNSFSPTFAKDSLPWFVSSGDELEIDAIVLAECSVQKARVRSAMGEVREPLIPEEGKPGAANK